MTRPIAYYLALAAACTAVVVAQGCTDAETLTSPDGSVEVEFVESGVVSARPFQFTVPTEPAWDKEPYTEWEGLSTIAELEHANGGNNSWLEYVASERWVYTSRGERHAEWNGVRRPEEAGKRFSMSGPGGGQCWCCGDNPKWQSTTRRKSCKMCDEINPRKGDCNCVECRCVKCGYSPEALYSVPPEELPATAEKPNHFRDATEKVEALQAETTRSLEELKTSARENAKNMRNIREWLHEERPEIDFGVAGMGMYSVAAPKGEYLAMRLARLCHEQYELPAKNVIVTVYYGPKNVAEVEPHESEPHRAIRVYVEAESGADATVLVERALDALAERPQRTLEPEAGRGVPE